MGGEGRSKALSCGTLPSVSQGQWEKSGGSSLQLAGFSLYALTLSHLPPLPSTGPLVAGPGWVFCSICKHFSRTIIKAF